LGKYNFCRKLIDYAQREGVSQVFTFAAMATPSELTDHSRVVGVATDEGTLIEYQKHEVGTLAGGRISGMNGILLGVAAERQMAGGCLLGEVPHMFINVPYPKASMAVLDVFRQIIDADIDLNELKLEVERMENYLSDALNQIQRLEQQTSESSGYEDDETFLPDPMDNGKLTEEERDKINTLFDEASQDRSRAFELKRELDRLDVFPEYEDRFLDLFKKPNGDSG
jgi:proteasome assembly chaperone (PAC2) family protein